MPTYDYKCPGCGEVFEVRHSIHEDPTYTCPDCGKELVKVFLQAPGLKFVGDGWETKDERRKRYFMEQRRRLKDRRREALEHNARLRPNVMGQVTDNWEDAASLAREKGLDPKPFLDMSKSS